MVIVSPTDSRCRDWLDKTAKEILKFFISLFKREHGVGGERKRESERISHPCFTPQMPGSWGPSIIQISQVDGRVHAPDPSPATSQGVC